MKISIGFIALAFIFLFGCIDSSNGNQVTNGNEITNGNQVTNGNEITNGSEIEDEDLVLYFFWGDGCPHCTTQKTFLDQLQKDYPDLEIKMYEVWKNQNNAQLFRQVAEKYEITAGGVPATFLGQRSWVGYNSRVGDEIRDYLEFCKENECENIYN